MRTVTVRYLGYLHETGCHTCVVFNGQLTENTGMCIEEMTVEKLKSSVEKSLQKLSKGKKLEILKQNKGNREIIYKF